MCSEKSFQSQRNKKNWSGKAKKQKHIFQYLLKELFSETLLSRAASNKKSFYLTVPFFFVGRVDVFSQFSLVFFSLINILYGLQCTNKSVQIIFYSASCLSFIPINFLVCPRMQAGNKSFLANSFMYFCRRKRISIVLG